MIIKSLELENIRSYSKQKIEFLEGINFLSGDIGSGKSSILQAIEFAFFGFKRGDLEGYQLLRKGERIGNVKLILEDKNQEIEIFRSIKKGKTNDNINQENGYLKLNGNLMELSPNELNTQIFELLNFPKSFIRKDKNLVYRFTIYTPQEQLKEILFSDPNTRLELIRKIFNIDKYKQLTDSISIYLSKLRDDKNVLNVKIEPFQKLEEEIKQSKKESEELENKIKVYENSLEEFNLKNKKYQDALLKREELQNKVKDKIHLIEKNLSKIEEIEKLNLDFKDSLKEKEDFQKQFSEKDFIKQKKDLEVKIKDLNNDLKENQEKISKLKKEQLSTDKLKKEKETLEKKVLEIKSKKELILSKKKSFDYMLTKCKVKDLGNKIKKLNLEINKLSKKEKEYEDSKNKIIELKIEIKTLEKTLKEKKDSQIDFSKLNNCPTCFQDIDCNHKDKILNKVNQEIKSLGINIDDKNIELEKNQIIIGSFDLNKFNELKQEILKLEESLKLLKLKEKEELKLDLDLKLEEKQLNKLNEIKLLENIQDLTLKLEKELDLNKIEIYQEKENKIKDLISEDKIKLLDLENNYKNFKNLKDEISNLNSKIKKNDSIITKKIDFNAKLKVLGGKLTEILETKNKVKEVLEKIRIKEKDILTNLSSHKTNLSFKKKLIENNGKELKQIISFKENLLKLLEDENFLSKEVVDISNIIERTLFTKFYVEFTEEFEYVFKELIEDNSFEVRLDEEFSPIIEQNGYDISIKNLSGGEKSSLAISYRLGLKKIIESNFNDNKLSILILDEPTDGFSMQQVDRLGSLLKESNLKQIILVSHDEKIETIAENILHVEKENHVSKVS